LANLLLDEPPLGEVLPFKNLDEDGGQLYLGVSIVLPLFKAGLVRMVLVFDNLLRSIVSCFPLHGIYEHLRLLFYYLIVEVHLVQTFCLVEVDEVLRFKKYLPVALHGHHLVEAPLVQLVNYLKWTLLLFLLSLEHERIGALVLTLRVGEGCLHLDYSTLGT